MKHKSKHSNNKDTNKIEKIFRINAYYIIFALAIFCLLVSVLVLNEKKYYETGEKGLCTVITDGNGCQIVQTSKYAQIFGFKNPYLGIVGFSALALVAIGYNFYRKKLLKYAVIAGGIASGTLAIYFLYVQEFILTIYCLFCVIVDITSLILLGISIYLIYKSYR